MLLSRCFVKAFHLTIILNASSYDTLHIRFVCDLQTTPEGSRNVIYNSTNVDKI